MLQGPDDTRDALVTIHPGAGGTESQDWAEMLLRMYVRWGERHGFEVELLDRQEGEEAGDRKSTRLNSSHANISYAVFCLKKKKNTITLNQIQVDYQLHYTQHVTQSIYSLYLQLIHYAPRSKKFKAL